MSSTSTTADPPSGSSIAARGVKARAEAAAAAAAAATPPPPEREGAVEIVDAGGGDAGVPVIAPAAVYNKNGEPHAVDAAVVKAVDDFTVPAGIVRKGSREKSYMYSLRVYIEASSSDKHQFFCMADSLCRRKNKMIPCKGGDRSNVNSHLKNGHGVQGMGGVVKEGKRKAAKQSITANFAASKNSGVGTDRIMLEPSEVVRDEEGNLSATLPAADSRTAHVRGVLKVENGESVRVGVVNAGRMDDASIAWEEPTDPPEGAPPPDIPGRQKGRKSSPKWMDLVLDLGPSDRQLLKPVPDEQRPKVALMLAVPRPLQLERILPVVASLGVTTIVLCQAKKVPKFYFGSHFFRDPPSVREKLIEGLSQSGDTVMPEVMVARRLKIFLEDDLDRCFPRDRWVRALAHPTRLPAQVSRCAGGEATAAATAAGGEGVGVEAGVVAATAQSGRVDGVESDGAATAPVPALRFSQIEPPKGCDPADVGVLVAVGPEGGWVEPDELQLLQSFGFQAVTLGSRVLRSDVAVNALLALAHAWVDERAAGTQYSAVQQETSVAPAQ